MNLPPQARPGGGAIQSQELSPPTGERWSPRRRQASGAAARRAAARASRQRPPGRAAAPPPLPPPPPQDDASRGRAAGAENHQPDAVFSGLDKITGRIISFDVAINETVQFGALQVTPRVCYSRPPTETPQTDAFVEVDEVTLQGEIKRIFTGWMFAASPGLHAVEHPIYDVWLTDCKGGKNPAVRGSPAPQEAAKAARAKPPRAQAAGAAPPRPPPPPRRAAAAAGNSE